MERKLVTVKTIDFIEPIEGADRVETVVVGGWNVVVPKGLYKAGEDIVFFEIDSMIPKQKGFEYLFTGDAKDKEVLHVKTQKLRGVLSQGVIAKLEMLKEKTANIQHEVDYSELFGVTKYESPVALNSNGTRKEFPDFIPKTDEIRYQTFLADNKGVELNPDEWMATEKIDGTSVTIYCKDGKIGICSRNQEILEPKAGATDSYWEVASKTMLGEISIFDWLSNKQKELGVAYIAVQGELFGEGIQKNPLRIQGQKILFFNLIVAGEYIPYEVIKEKYTEVLKNWVPIHDVRLAETPEEIIAQPNGVATRVNDSGAQIEGFVWRHLHNTTLFVKRPEPDWSLIPEEKHELVRASLNRPFRASFKVISNNDLLSKGE